MKTKLLIVGGVAGGASAAARARRLSEEAQIIIFERGAHVSFANCGLPYFVGGEIKEEKTLLLQTPESFKKRFDIEVRVRNEVVQINRGNKHLRVRNLETGTEYDESFDHLILATGASPLRPSIPGIDLASLHTVRDVSDSVRIRKKLSLLSKKRAIVVGGGYIGLEIAEQLVKQELNVTLIEGLPQVMAPIDEEMASLLHREIRKHGVELVLDDPVSRFIEQGTETVVQTKSGLEFSAPLVILALGVRPETTLAREAGLELGASGGIKVNDFMQTSDPSIWAVGDSVEVKDLILQKKRLIPLAGPANRQGRVVADNIFGKPRVYAGSIGSSVLRLFSLTVAATGANERTLKKEQIPYEVIYLHPGSHAAYYPGATAISMKVLFSPLTNQILGAQAIGQEGVEKRIDVLATAIKGKLSLDEIADLELCYAPPYSSAKDPVNLVGMMAQNVRDGLLSLANWKDVNENASKLFILDVREEVERQQGFIKDSVHIPLSQLRARLSELPRDKTIVVYCQSGQRSYYACRILAQHGIACRNLSGAFKTYQQFHESLT